MLIHISILFFLVVNSRPKKQSGKMDTARKPECATLSEPARKPEPPRPPKFWLLYEIVVENAVLFLLIFLYGIYICQIYLAWLI